MTKRTVIEGRTGEFTSGASTIRVVRKDPHVMVYRNGRPYAGGVWEAGGGYVRYTRGTSSRDDIDWPLLDAVDKLLRRETNWQPFKGKIENVREVLAILAKRPTGEPIFVSE